MNSSSLLNAGEEIQWTGLHCSKNALTDFFGWFLQGVLASLAFTCLIVIEEADSPRRSCWVRSNNLTRDIDGYFKTVYSQIKEVDPEEFFKHTRMSRATYDILLSLVRQKLTKKSHRRAISAECRLALTLSFLSQGVSHSFLGCSFKMGRSTVREIILQTCEILWESLREVYVPKPNIEDFQKIAMDFENLWDLPHCVGAIDGKHINIQTPPNLNDTSASSIVLLAACDARYIFSYVDIGAYGSQSHGGILANSKFGKQLFSGQLPLPMPSKLPNSEINLPYYFVGDEAFPLKENLMRPYPGKRLDPEKRVLNYRLSRARVIIENTFGILVSRWKVLQSSLACLPENAEKIVLATIALHNFIKRNEANSSRYCPPSYVDHEDEMGNIIRGEWRIGVQNDSLFTPAAMGSNNAAYIAFGLRDSLKNYCLNEGAIQRQNRIA